MKALIVADAHLYKTPDGKVWTKTIYGNDFWQRYLDVFETIDIAARMCECSYDEVDGCLRVDGDNISFRPMPMARGGKEYILHLPQILKRAKAVTRDESCAIIRLPSIIATFIYPHIVKQGIPHGIEVVANPNETFSNPIVRRILTNQLKKAALTANGAAYVTQFALQKEYPSYAMSYGSDKNHFEEYYSSITLSPDKIEKPKCYREKQKFSLVHTSNSISHDEKGHSVVIKVVKTLRDKGYNVEVNFIGDGSMRPTFEKLAEDLGIGDYVHFTGWLSSSDEVRNVLRENDIFIFPSVSEGLPRSVIEAMAVGLPCVASKVGGIPELIPEQFLFAPKDVNGFVSAVEKLITNPLLMEEESRRSIDKASQYTVPVLQSRRNDYYSKIKAIAEHK